MTPTKIENGTRCWYTKIENGKRVWLEDHRIHDLFMYYGNRHRKDLPGLKPNDKMIEVCIREILQEIGFKQEPQYDHIWTLGDPDINSNLLGKIEFIFTNQDPLLRNMHQTIDVRDLSKLLVHIRGLWLQAVSQDID